MQVTVVDHPLVAERLTRLRDKTTKRPEFRRNLEELTAFLVYEAMRNQPVVPIEIDTPMAPTQGVQVANPPLVVPVMRAGLGMLHSTLNVMPNARVGFVGLKRDEETFLPHAYVNTVPEQLEGKRVHRARPDARDRRLAGAHLQPVARRGRRAAHRGVRARGA